LNTFGVSDRVGFLFEGGDIVMSKAKFGDRVRVQCLGVRENGNGIDRHRGQQMLEFTVGDKDVIPGINSGVVGMAEGEQKRLTLQPKDAYGVIHPELIKEVSRQRFPRHLKLHVGQRLRATGVKSGRRRLVEVAELKPNTVVVDGNHPLAGEVLEVELQLISVVSS
jgi:peptidylprolyl isomerase